MTVPTTGGRDWVCIRHTEYEDAGVFATVAAELGVPLRTVAIDRDERVPTAAEIGGLIVMGGPFSAADVDQREHLRQERALLRDAVTLGLPVLGVCLGAQLLSSALGGEVRRAVHGEHGTREIVLTGDGRRDPVLGPEGPVVRVFQFHDDSFTLPPGAVRLASSDACPEQAFRFGERAYGFQAHFEMPDPFAAAIPAAVRPSPDDRVGLAALGRRTIERFMRIAVSDAPSPGPPVAATADRSSGA